MVQNSKCYIKTNEIKDDLIFLPAKWSKDPGWHQGLDPWQRCYEHYTIASMARKKNYRYVNKDELDFCISSTYQHNLELFPDKFDIYLQQDTIQAKKKDVSYKKIKESDKKLDYTFIQRGGIQIIQGQLYKNHPLRFGGIIERVHPSSVKLMNSSNHSPQTNAGYCRQDNDGNRFQY